MVHEAQSSSTCVDETAPPVTPAKASNNRREQETKDDDQVQVPAMLPLDDLVLAQIADVRNTRLTAGLDEHPANMRPPQTLVRVVRVELRVRVPVVRAVAARPPLDGPLHGAATGGRKEVLERLRRVVRAVRPEPVVPSRDAWKEKGLSPV